MAEITVDYYTMNTYNTNVNKVPSGKLSITPRGNGCEYKIIKSDGTLTMKVYSLRKDGFGITTHESFKGLYVFRDRFNIPILDANAQGIHMLLKKDDAMRLYDFFADLIEWSPGALESGTAHPDLLAAKARHSAGRGGSRRRTRRRVGKARRL